MSHGHSLSTPEGVLMCPDFLDTEDSAGNTGRWPPQRTYALMERRDRFIKETRPLGRE